MHSLSKLIKKELIIDLSNLNFEKDRICDAYQMGKQTRVSFKSKNIISTFRPLELLHMNLFGPIRTTSLGGKRYDFVIIDDFFRFIWIFFLAHKDETFHVFSKFYRKVTNEKYFSIQNIRSDHRTEFENQNFKKFCDEKGIDHNFSAPRTFQ